MTVNAPPNLGRDPATTAELNANIGIGQRVDMCLELTAPTRVAVVQSNSLVPTPNSFFNENLDRTVEISPPPPTDSSVSLPLQPAGTKHSSNLPLIPDSDKRALQRLVSGAVPHDELPSLIKSIVTNVKAASIAKCLQGSDAQAFIDVMDEALDNFDLEPRVRRKCVKSLYKTCSGHTLLPRSLRFELPEDAIGDLQCQGGFADVLRYECHGREVAVKALRVNSQVLQDVTKMFYKEVITWRNLRHPNVLPLLGVVMAENKFAMVSEWMTNGNINQFVAARRDANRFQLLADVAEGLIHMHRHGMIHGDLKGENILIDQAGNARLADFGLLTITSDTTNITSSNSFLEGGTYLRMSPELLDPEGFDLKDNRPTKSSDCYALGMAVYEVLSGRVPFYHYKDCTSFFIIAKVLDGEHPKRPQGAEGTWFTNDVWNILERCWKTSPGNRPKVKHVHRCLEKGSKSWIPPPQMKIGPAAAGSSGKGRIRGGGPSSSQPILPPQSQRLSVEAPSRNTPGSQPLGMSMNDLSSSEESEGPSRMSHSDSISQNTPPRGQYTRDYQEVPPQSHSAPSKHKRSTSRFGSCVIQ